MMLDACSQAKPQEPLFWVNQVVQDLIQDQELVRIKKLLIYTCTQTWESNLDQIHAADLQNLMQILLVIAPTLEKLQLLLHNVANSLNKSAEYTLIANTILDLIEKRYPASVNEVEIYSPLTQYQKIAEQLHQDPEEFRIRKLLLLACQDVWITDRYQLAQFDLAALVQELYELSPSTEHLQFILKSRIQKLSKSAVYLLILDRIMQALQPLYQINSQVPASDPSAHSQPKPTKLLPQLPSRSTKQMEQKSAIQRRSNSAIKAVQPQRNIADLFDLRLEIIRYANPFRTKILLYSLLHEPFNQTTEHHLMLKNYDLDDLLRTSLQIYQSFEELETNLLKIAKQLGDCGEYVQIAQIMLRAIKLFYTQVAIVAEAKDSCNLPENISGNASGNASGNTSGNITGTLNSSDNSTQPGLS